jgi:hypothetical protein
MKLSPNNKGYYMVGLSCNGERSFKLVHRLVAAAFLPNPDNHLVVNHKDLNITNNHFSNLEWCTYSENTRHYFKNTAIKRSLPSLEKEELLEIIKYYNDNGCNKKDTIAHFGLETTEISLYDLVSGRRYSEVTGIIKHEGDRRFKITECDVLEILKAYYDLHISARILYKKYGISEAQFYRIINGQRHKEIFDQFFASRNS